MQARRHLAVGEFTRVGEKKRKELEGKLFQMLYLSGLTFSTPLSVLFEFWDVRHDKAHWIKVNGVLKPIYTIPRAAGGSPHSNVTTQTTPVASQNVVARHGRLRAW